MSDGGKHEKPTFLRTQHVCAWNDLIQSRSVMLSVLINGCVCAWMCFRVEHVCAGLWRQQLQSSRDSRRRGQQCAELGRLIWEAVGGPLWSPTLYGETHSVLFFLLLLSFSTSSGILKVLRCGIYVSVCVCITPQSFLKSEVSAENILFWQACEKFRKIPATSLDEVWWHLLPLHTESFYVLIVTNCAAVLCFTLCERHIIVCFPDKMLNVYSEGNCTFNSFFLFCFYYITI